jgi:hypothetical protein
MKITIFIVQIAIASLLLQISCKKAHHSHVPQGVNLKNHFGLPSVEYHYGPKSDNYDNYVQANSDTFTPFSTIGRRAIEKAVEFEPYPGYEKKLVPHYIKSGEMSNIAPSAKTIVTPEITAPKAHIQTNIEYPAVVRLPTFYGMKKDWKDVAAYNKQTGQLVRDKVLVESPSMGYEDHVQKITRHHDQYIDLRNGKRLYDQKEEKVLHGTDDTEKKKRRRRRFF